MNIQLQRYSAHVARHASQPVKRLSSLLLINILSLGLATSTVLAQRAPLISRQVLFGNPERVDPKLSPDGQYLTYLAPDQNNVLQLWIRTIGQQDDRILTQEPKRGIPYYRWTYDGENILYEQDDAGNEDYRLYLVSIKTKAVRELTPKQGVRAELVDLSPQAPNEALVAMNLNNPFKHDIYRINLKTGEAVLDTENPGNGVDATTDANFQVRSAKVIREDGGSDLGVREGPGESWQILRQWEANSNGHAVSFSEDGRLIYVIDNQDSNTSQLKEINLWNKQERVLAQDPEYDLAGALVHPKTRQIVAVSILRDRLQWQVLDPSYKEDFQAFSRVQSGDVRVENCDLDVTVCVTSYTDAQQPKTYYLYRRATRESTRLFSEQPQLENLDLAEMKPISYQTRDGLTVHGYLTTPVGVPAQNLPTVLKVHGGPWGRDTWKFDPMAQWLANRGYAVLQVNFRGSTGYGKKFLNAGNKEWAGKMHLDLIDGVNWLKQQGIADPKKVAIAGGSYGGYATLVGLTFTPEVFAAGVDIVGPSNLITLLNSVPPYWFAGRPIWDYRLGNPKRDTEFLKSRSPLFLADRIQKPLLIGHGANDPRVKQAESDQIVKTMRKEKKPVEYWVYDDEGHGFKRPENRLHFFAQMEKFLGQHLGGQVEPEGNHSGHSGRQQ